MKEAKDRWIEYEAVKRFERRRRGLSRRELKAWRDCYWTAYWRLRHALTRMLRSEEHAMEFMKDWRRMGLLFDPPRRRGLRRAA